MSDVGRSFPKCHLMSKIFPPSSDSKETGGEKKHKTREIMPLGGLSAKTLLEKRGSTRFPESSHTQKKKKKKISPG